MRRLVSQLGPPERMGLALLLLWIAWSATAAALAGHALSPRSPYVVAPLMLAVGVALGRIVSRRSDSWVTPLALLGLTILLLVSIVTTAGPGEGFTGYANADAALAVQLIGLCGVAMLRADPMRRRLLALAALAALAVVLANRSMAGLAVAVPLLAVVVVMAWRPVRERSWTNLAVLAAAAVTSGAGIGVTVLADRVDWPAWSTRALEPARHSLWREALALWREHPVIGAGPGAFERVSILGRDPDTAAAHSAFLQVGAETGWVGVALFALLVLAGLLWAARGAPAYAVVGAAAWTALLVHSFVDHLLDFPAVVLTAGMVIGWAGASRALEELDVPKGQSPGRR